MPTHPSDLSNTLLWREYKRDRTAALRNELITRYLPLVRYNAERILSKLPDEVELDDLVSAGIFGLMDALDGFDMERGVKFETYCTQRIRGAILDELRNLDWVPRLVRNRSGRMDRTASQLESELGRSPTEAELVRRMRISPREFQKLRRDSVTVGMVSLSRKFAETDSNRDIYEVDVIEDKRGLSPSVVTQRKDLRDFITRGLSRAERLILILYYYEELTMKEIGAALDLSESRVSQMHSAVLERLKAELAHRKLAVL